MKAKTTKVVAGEGWFTVSIEGLKKTLARKGLSVAIYELAQNAMDTDATLIELGLSPIEDGISTLTCIDNSTVGFSNLDKAHEMYRESAKKGNPLLRGKFNLGEKFVVALCNESSITSMSGQIIFARDKTRRMGSKKTAAGTQFCGELPITPAEYAEVCSRAKLLIPPDGVMITFNGKKLGGHELLKSFETKLPTEIADDSGILRPTRRNTTVRIFRVKSGEKAWLYEMGIPVVNLPDDMNFHVDIGQKIPSNTERDNVSPAFLKHVFTAVLNQTHGELIDQATGTASWVTIAFDSKEVSKEATHAIIKARYGDNVVAHDTKDKGSDNEAMSRGHKVVQKGSLSPQMWKNVKKYHALKKSGDVFPTDQAYLVPKTVIAPVNYTPNMGRFEKLITDISPVLIDHVATVRFISDERGHFSGCSQWREGAYLFTVNLAFHDVDNWLDNFSLLQHEATHHACQNNNHLGEEFWRNQEKIGARMTAIALADRKMFAGISDLEDVLENKLEVTMPEEKAA